jgi:3-hydroxybutyryl-CoA dehydratase
MVKSEVRTEFASGEQASISKTVNEEDIELFAKVTGDYNPVHINDDFAAKTRFKGRIAHGLISAGLIGAVLGTKLPGPGSIYLGQSLKFLAPVRIGDEVTAEATVTDWNPTKRIMRLTTRCFNQNGVDVLTGEAVLLVEPVEAAKVGE